MSPTANQLLQAALTLPDEERVEFANRLWESVDEFASDEFPADWDREIARRIKEADEGTEPSIPIEEVDRILRERHGFLTD